MRYIKKIISILFFICCTANYALATSFFLAQHTENSPLLIFARADQETEAEAIEKYLQAIHSHKLSPTKIHLTPISSFERNLTLQTPQILLLANEVTHMQNEPSGTTAENFRRRLKKHGAEIYTLPLAADIHLKTSDAKNYQKFVAKNFDAMIALGGDDIDPALYGERNKFAKHTNRIRDKHEIAFVKKFTRENRGIFFGICRGHQLCAVVHGQTLIQDIAKETRAEVNHKTTDHNIDLKENSWLRNLFSKDKIAVNSMHHEAIDPKPNRYLQYTAFSLDPEHPIVEAAEFKNKLGYTFQFHPELMENETGEIILKGIIAQTMANKEKLRTQDNLHCKQSFQKL